MQEALQSIWTERLHILTGKKAEGDQEYLRIRESLGKRDMQLVKANVSVHTSDQKPDSADHLPYQAHIHWLYQGKSGRYYKEERVEPRVFTKGEDIPSQHVAENREALPVLLGNTDETIRSSRFHYDRREAVRYADMWWNSYNPAYRMFEVDCTNYISQCLRAGGAPMRGQPDRAQGWWYTHDNWSYSWAVAHSMRWYLSGSTSGLRGIEVESPLELHLGDVICYDFDGNGRWDHNTIVTNFDEYGEPLVNAHTYNSRNRYWAYEDSTAYTPNIQYKFFHIV
ncbi:amidase domain-containing protein [Bacillaceae bacterium SIJ1]|uniref:amidase domain-containing protein n=1 Tax=Litoribacterium kuwaitense TaxID=1398745 RepID=UPI0013ECE738|nr:amidase domain-containing protein [Litoribacterium kuwaitense]NGP43868.1 amidase domain-containing protein [Litoribacterium kuwaitense]